MKNKIIIAIIFLQVYSCRKINNCDKKEDLTFYRTDFNGSQLKLNGYYLTEILENSQPLFLYKNGVFIGFNIPIIDSKEISSFEASILNGSFFNSVKNDKYSWGLFNVNGNEIKSEFFAWKSSLTCKYPVIKTGNILNDTTILFNKVSNVDGTEAYSLHDTFYFKQFSPKPDSTNSFIK